MATPILSRPSLRAAACALLLATLGAAAQPQSQNDALRQFLTTCPAPKYLSPPDPDDVARVWNAGQRYQLVIGADEYAMAPEQNRDYVRTTAQVVSSRLNQVGFAPLPSLTSSLNEPFLVGSSATKERIWAAIGELRRRSQGADFGIIYYVGHGSIAPNHQDLTLATYDRPIVNDEGIRVSDIIGALSLGEYRTNIRQVPKIIIVLDTCYSGTFLSGEGTVLTETEGIQKLATIADSYPTPEKTVIITATAPGNVNRAYELRGTGMSALGYFLGRALNEDWACVDTTADGILTIRELYVFLRDKLRAAHKAALLDGPMLPMKRVRDEASFIAYDPRRFAQPGDRGLLVGFTVTATAGPTANLLLPDGTAQVCAPSCSAVVSKHSAGTVLVRTNATVDMNKMPEWVTFPAKSGRGGATGLEIVEQVSVKELVEKRSFVGSGARIVVR